ncbi:putative ysc84 actin-binding domain-containing protein [Rosa chinensis]|uniref:Putative ysc84 actin-binding domain-containing protein n=1 Tax=Rosa chinensis TaxID=74649 RepID=A0A2P6RL10_ROSCH|nr:putative ysc84 actin-binding domain-containing protein [Rosa chinensis]
MRAGDRGSGMCYTYSCSKGAFVAVSLEGNVVDTRMDTNLQFYGDPYLTTNDILLGIGQWKDQRPRSPCMGPFNPSTPVYSPR